MAGEPPTPPTPPTEPVTPEESPPPSPSPKRFKLVRQDAKWGNELIAALNKYKEAQQ